MVATKNFSVKISVAPLKGVKFRGSFFVEYANDFLQSTAEKL